MGCREAPQCLPVCLLGSVQFGLEGHLAGAACTPVRWTHPQRSSNRAGLTACLLAAAGVEVLAECPLTGGEEGAAAGGRSSVVVAVRSGHLLATAFHPELTQVWPAACCRRCRCWKGGSGCIMCCCCCCCHCCRCHCCRCRCCCCCCCHCCCCRCCCCCHCCFPLPLPVLGTGRWICMHSMHTPGAWFACSGGSCCAQCAVCILLLARPPDLSASPPHPTPPPHSHPSCVQDTRWHELFVEMIRQPRAGAQTAAAAATEATPTPAAAAAPAAGAAPNPWAKLGRAPTRPADLPVY